MDHFLGDYQTSLREAVEMTARERGADFHCVVGRTIDSPYEYERVQNQIFHEITGKAVSGILVMSSALSLYCGKEAVAELCRSFAPLPVCSIGLRIDGVPSVVPDNRLISLAVKHLADEHGCKRFAFIGGPPANDEAVIRKAAVIESLDELGLALAPELVETGEFTMHSGCEAISRILQRRIPFDAVVVANDTMALGALSILKKNNIDVPGDVKVIGFDDIPAGRFHSPRLTTIRQRLEEIGRYAVELMLRKIRGETVPIVMEVAPRLVRRQSCGCTRGVVPIEGFLSIDGAEIEDLLREKRRALEQLLVLNVQIPEPAFSGWASRLIHALSREAAGDSGQFTRALKDILGAAEHRQWVIDELQNAVSLLREQFVSLERTDAMDLGSVWYESQMLLMDASAQGYIKNQIAADLTSALFLRRTAADLPAALTEEELVRAISGELETIGIRNGLVSAFAKGSRDKLECVVAILDGAPVEQRRTTYDVHAIVPPFLKQSRRMSYVVIPLSSGATRLGVMVLEAGAADLYYEILREHMSSYLKHAVGAEA
jgi:DNA-binding LacI/PurR family transcriptional regulator